MDEKMVKVNGYTQMDMFSVDAVAKASKHAGLCKWCTAMMIYDAVAKNVGPKKEALKAAARLKEASKR